MTVPIRILVADDQRVVREGLVMVLGMLDDVEVVGTAADGTDAVAMAVRLHPDIVLMDLRMPRCDGVQATRQLREREPRIKVVVLTTYADDRSVIEALRAGARGYLTKDASGEELQQGLWRVFNDGAVIDPAVQHHVLDAIEAAPRPAPSSPSPSPAPFPGGMGGTLPDGLTPREAEVLSLIAGGLANAEIASQLVVSERTVKSHINHLFPKIGARDRAQAVGYAYQHGLADPGR